MNLRLPSFWKGMSFTAKAAHLCATGQASDYSDACRVLASLQRKKPARPTATQYQAKMEQMKLL